jgi:hypothetical protein
MNLGWKVECLLEDNEINVKEVKRTLKIVNLWNYGGKFPKLLTNNRLKLIFPLFPRL